MADTPYTRVAIRYRSYDRYWWEIFGRAGTSFDAVVPGLAELIAASLACRHPSCYVQYVRLSNPFAPRQAQIEHITQPELTIGSTKAAVTSTAAIYQFKGADLGTKRQIWIRGLRDSDVTRRASNGQDLTAGTLDANVRSYFNVLLAQNYGIPNLFPVDGSDNKRHPIDSITVLPLGVCRINTTDTFVMGTRNRLLLYKIPQKLFPGLKGQITGKADAGSITLQGYTSRLAEGVYEMTGAAFRKAEYRFSQFKANSASFLAFDRRDTAGGPLSTRGSSRALIRRSG